MKHPVVHRTSPKGTPFIGRCVSCGKEGLTLKQISVEECPNPKRMTNKDSILEAIEPHA